jgi:hypothetical protein
VHPARLAQTPVMNPPNPNRQIAQAVSLNAARLRSGVLAPAQFAFLKLVDRRLWYALHALGFEADAPLTHSHPSQRVEAMGARAHWAAERTIGAPIPTPEIDAAIAAIRSRWPVEGSTSAARKSLL